MSIGRIRDEVDHVQLRAGTAADVAGIVELIHRENHRPADPDRIRRRLDQMPSVIAESDTGIVAFIYCRRFSPDLVELSNMVVDSSLRRQGLGGRMVDSLEPQLQAAGFRGAIFVNCRLHIGTNDQRAAAARAFWIRRGYRIVFATHGSALFSKAFGPSAPAAPDDAGRA
jgi:ribosomal protein S18 acetylase RimI-like enzyme